jgi:hypothetical protein
VKGLPIADCQLLILQNVKLLEQERSDCSKLPNEQERSDCSSYQNY